MQKTKIEWCDSTWNPITGCLHGCPYCYAKMQTKRFEGRNYGYEIEKNTKDSDGSCHFLKFPYKFKTKKDKFINAFYPFGFDPTFHSYRLDEPQKIIDPQNVFVCSMADLFGEWIPNEWIQEVFKACRAAPQHRYLFLTKNPARYLELYENKAFPYSNNIWLGSTCTKPDDPFTWVENTPYKYFISIEPLLEPFGKIESDKFPDWVIIGAETGNRKDKIIPKREWIENIVNQCRTVNVPVFIKNSLIPIMGEENMLREFPWEVA